MPRFRLRTLGRFWLLLTAILLALTVSIFWTARTQAGTDVAVGFNGNEPHATVVNPRNPSNVIVSNVNQLRISNDFGATFPILVNATIVPAGYGQCGDDVMAFDAANRLWWSYLTCIDNAPFNNFPAAEDDITVVVQQVNPTTGALIGAATDVTPGNHNDDKQWIAADTNPSSPYANNVYLHWTRFDNNPTEEAFSRCVDCANTNTFSAPAIIATGNGEGFRHQANVATAPNGDVYVAYHTNTCGNNEADGDIMLMRDSSGGANLAAGGNPPTGVTKVSVFGAGGAEVTCNRQPNPPTVPNAHFLMQGSAAPFVVADPVRPGNIYVIANDDPNNLAGSGDDGDVMLARSTNYGASFTVSRVDHAPQGPASLQVFPQGSIDQDGNLVVSWYDTRRQINNNAGTPGNPADDYWNLDLYATVSRDGAQTFSNDFRINDTPFDPQLGAPNFGSPPDNPPTFRIGEYNGLAAVNGIGYAAWTGNSAGGQQILFDLFSLAGVFPDRFEPNESRDFAVVAALGANDSYNEKGLTLHTATDVDFFKVTALHTGKLEVNIAFNEVIAAPSVRVHDGSGNVIANGVQSTAQTGSSVSKLAIPVVQGQNYFVEVYNPGSPNTVAPQSTYDLGIVNRAAPTPFALDLQASSDSGRNDADDVTNDNTPTIQMRVDTLDAANSGIALLGAAAAGAGNPGYAVAVFDNGVQAGYADPVPGTNNTIWTITLPSALADGGHSITAKVRVFDGAIPQANGFGAESSALQLVIDTLPPATPGAPDLVASSDTGGISDDNITTVTTPKFAGSGERNALVRVAANAQLVGQSVLTTGGVYEVTTVPLSDGVYNVTAELEDLAGNVSIPSAPLKVTIANQSLTLPGATANPANALVKVDLAAGSVAGYPGIAGATGLAGIVGIPTVNLDTNGQGLTILGTAGNDGLYYAPTGAQAGTVTRDGSTQVINFANTGGAFTIDPLGGSDSVSTAGSVLADTITVQANNATTVQVNALKVLNVPIANVERLAVVAGQGNDVINVGTYATVNANLFVDAGEPTTNPPNGDSLNVADTTGKAQAKTQPGGAVPNSGSVLVDYSRTTGNRTRIDYVNAEKVKIVKSLTSAADDEASVGGSLYLPMITR